MRQALADAGAATPRALAHITDGSWEDALVAAQELSGSKEAGPAGDAEAVRLAQWAGELQQLQDIARGATAAEGARFAQRTPEDLAADADLLLRSGMGPLEEAARSEVRKRMLSYAPAPPAVRSRRLSADADVDGSEGPNARAVAEEARRRVQVEALTELLREAEAPVVRVAEASANPERVLAAAAGGRRARTLEKWIGVWRRYRAWLLDTSGYVFPQRASDMIDYMIMRADEPCGRSSLLAIRGLFQVMEEMAGVEGASRVSSLPAVVSLGEDLLAEVPQRVRSGGGEAPRYTRAHVVALERVVVDSEAPVYHRLYAFWKLLSTWGTLRFDDHRGCGTGTLKLGVRGLEGCLSRTKTTGRGKRVAHRPLLVSRGAFVQEGDWLATGWVLWAEWAPDHRDYFLRPPTAGYAGLEAREMTYTQAAAATRALHRHLPGPGGQSLLPSAQAAAYWTEHTPRNYLPSAAALLEFPPEWIDSLGCWSPTGSKAYIRTVQARAKIMQDRVAEALRDPERSSLFDDGSVIDGLAAHLESRGATEEEVDLQRGLLSVACAEDLEPSLPGVRLRGDESDNATVVPSPSEPSSEAEGPCNADRLDGDSGDLVDALFADPAPSEQVGNVQPVLLPVQRGVSGGSFANPPDFATPRIATDAAASGYGLDIPGWSGGACGPAIASARTCGASAACGSSLPRSVEDQSEGSNEHRMSGGSGDLWGAGARASDPMDAGGFTWPRHVEDMPGGSGDPWGAGARASDPMDAGGSTRPRRVEGLRVRDGGSGEMEQKLPDVQFMEDQAEEELGAAPATPPVKEAASGELLREASAVLEPVQDEAPFVIPAEEQGYVVSLGKRGWRRLHYLGGCSRLPGVHYLRFELLGIERPPPDGYDDVCQQCWGPKGRAPALDEVVEDSPGELSPETSEAEEP